MSELELTDEEKRNLEVIKEWAHCWNTPGLAARLVDEIYADDCEVFTPLQNMYHAKMGKSKKSWRRLELEVEKLYKKREMRIVSTMSRGDTVALEAAITIITAKGRMIEGWFAAFLKFKDGRIFEDHTYMKL